MYSDPIADYLTRLRNASAARKRDLSMPSSRTKVAISEVLKQSGYINDYRVEPFHTQGILHIQLRYGRGGQPPALVKLRRISRPGLRSYVPARAIPRVLNGLGIAILSTSKGIMTDKTARKAGVGGEVLCYVY